MTHNRYVGILLNAPVYDRLSRGKSTGHEQISFYEEAAAAHGLTLCYLKLSGLTPGRPNRPVPALVRKGGRYARTLVETPTVIHNRAIHLDSRSNGRLEALSRGGTEIFNLHTRYDKLMLHRLLEQNPAIRPHLPLTERARPEMLQRLMREYPALIVKPSNGSVGQGIMLLSLTEQGKWRWKYRSAKTGAWRTLYFTTRMPAELVRRLRKRNYLVQYFLPLAKFQGRPFDIRVSVQKNEAGLWQTTGMVAKVARTGAFLTNVAQGGKVATMDEIFAEHPGWNGAEIQERISQLSVQIAEFLDVRLVGLADLGLDMGIMEDGHLIFIEANGRDQRYSFGEAGMHEVWKAVYRNPMGYARFLRGENKTP
ncbi:YheC/YheD family protein [Paenibacillus sp. YN15]|uniref:YheC/YheD family endospore coat-associated protein n=1 Tax=Paenibacillus sp. YN15 TaxID=1742774 RepID=UPI000DCDCDD2|nr:YheC/YheD family protein [Paenibacillus sp. YN15]RAV01237.1 YheC/YheD family protein [Paenibacillus sp. YN15]